MGTYHLRSPESEQWQGPNPQKGRIKEYVCYNKHTPTPTAGTNKLSLLAVYDAKKCNEAENILNGHMAQTSHASRILFLFLDFQRMASELNWNRKPNICLRRESRG